MKNLFNPFSKFSISGIIFFFAIILLSPSCPDKTPEYYYEQGKHYEAEGDYIRAIQYMTKAIEKNPQFVDAYMKRAWLNFSQDSFSLAIADYTKIIELRPKINNAEIYYLRGMTFYRSLQDTMACKDIKLSCEQNLNKGCDAVRKFCKK